MIIKRRLFFSEESDNQPEKIGKAAGTVILGTAGSLTAGKLGGNISKSIATNIESKKAVENYMKGARKLKNNLVTSNNSALNKLKGFKEGNQGRFFGKRRLSKAVDSYNKSLAENKSIYNDSLKKLRKSVITNRNKNISKASKLGKYGTIATGLGLTGLLASRSLKNSNEKNNIVSE